MMIRPTLLLWLLLATTATAQQTRHFNGTWNNRRYGTSGPLSCQARETRPGQWQATFSGSFRGSPFSYDAVFQSANQGRGARLSGNTTIRGDAYQWTGALQGNQLQGQFQSRSGNNGSFVLTEIGGASSNSPTNSVAEAPLPESFDPVINDGEQMLCIGNAMMGNEGGVQNYLKKALAKSNIEISTNELIFDDRPLQEMLVPEVGNALNLERFDAVLITSGPLDTMRTFAKRNEENGKRTIVFMTWPARHPGNRATVNQFTQSTRRSVETMRRFEKLTGATIAPVAVVFHSLTVAPPDGIPREDFLWHANDPYQNELGTMVAAWTLYATLTGESPVGINFDMPPYIVGRNLQSMPEVSLTRELRRDLQYRVWDVVREWNTGRTKL